MSLHSNIADFSNDVSLGLPPEQEGGARRFTVDELKESVGLELFGGWFKVDPTANDEFCRSTYIDVIYGADNPQAEFEEDLIEGFYLLSLVDALKARVYKDDLKYFPLNYGSNKLRFVEQVSLQSVLRFSCVINQVEKKGDGYLVELICKLEIRNSDRPALTYSSLYYLMPIPAAN